MREKFDHCFVGVMNGVLSNPSRLFACTSQISQRSIATTTPLCKNRAGKHRVSI